MLRILWVVCLVVAVVATGQAFTGTPYGWATALFWWAVTIGGYVWWGRNHCTFGHDWNMYAGYDQMRVHSQAVCRKCGMTGKEYIGDHSYRQEGDQE